MLSHGGSVVQAAGLPSGGRRTHEDRVPKRTNTLGREAVVHLPRF
jgi:hypothetical protein